jgi:hypothetical protein
MLPLIGSPFQALAYLFNRRPRAVVTAGVAWVALGFKDRGE